MCMCLFASVCLSDIYMLMWFIYILIHSYELICYLILWSFSTFYLASKVLWSSLNLLTVVDYKVPWKFYRHIFLGDDFHIYNSKTLLVFEIILICNSRTCSSLLFLKIIDLGKGRFIFFSYRHSLLKVNQCTMLNIPSEISVHW